MFDPVKEIVVTLIAAAATSGWWYFEPNPESRAAFVISVIFLFAAVVHLAYHLGKTGIKLRLVIDNSDDCLPIWICDPG